MQLVCLVLVAWLSCVSKSQTALGQQTADNSQTDSQSSERWLFINSWADNARPELVHDEAWLTLNVSTGFDVQLWARSHHCWQCRLVYVTTVSAHATTTIVVNTTVSTDLKLVRTRPGGYEEDLCLFTEKFREGGDYWVFMDYATAQRHSPCSLMIANDPPPAEMPILYVTIGLVGLALLYVLSARLYRYIRSSKWRKSRADITNPDLTQDTNNAFALNKDTAVTINNSTDTTPPPTDKKKTRLGSLDTFRGLSLSIMVFVNYGGGGYWFFEHPPWDGLTVADLVFPWFVFIMGTSMTFSFRSMYRRQMSTRAIVWKIVTRSVKLFALGLILNTGWGPVDLTKLRIPGVLQRFALTYLLIALLHLGFYRHQDSHQDRRWSACRDVILYLPEWLCHLCILSVYLALTYAMPVPGCPTGYTGPGGLSEDKRYENCTGGAARYIDHLVLGTDHIYQYPTPLETYQTTVAYDPEGILGTLTSVFLCFLGVQSGRILSLYPTHSGRIIRWLIWAVFTGGIAAILCKCSQHDGWVPLNKNLWSLSFVLTTACFAFFLLTFLYVIIDVMKWWGGQPFIYPGMNSIVVYFCHSIFFRVMPINWVIQPLHWKLLLQDVWGATFWIFVAYILFRKKIFVAL